jgi:putative Holliday junction resolvase
VARVLALDYGSARCGVAVSDPTGTLATPLPVVERPATRRGMGAILGLVREQGARTVVVGLPLGLSGSDTDQTRETRAFAERLRERLGGRVEIVLHDERFTTRMAERFGGEGDEDSRAAAHLLEGWLAGQP